MKTPRTLLSRLRRLKMTYTQYLASDHWKQMRQRYLISDLPKHCIACLDPRYQLHHQSYQRLGCEHVTDLVPLCRTCHFKLHEYHETSVAHLCNTSTLMRAVFGWSKKEAGRRLAPFAGASNRFGVPGIKKVDKLDRSIDKRTPTELPKYGWSKP